MRVVIASALAALFLCLAGCASDVDMTDEERAVCRDQGCTAWTAQDLLDLARGAAAEGYRRGWRDAVRQAGRDA